MADGTRFTYRRIRKILRGIRLGLSPGDAAALVGIPESRIATLREQRPGFRTLIRWAEAQAVADRLEAIGAASAFQAAAWWLERRRNEEFGRRTADDAALGQVRPESPLTKWEAAQGPNGDGQLARKVAG